MKPNIRSKIAIWTPFGFSAVLCYSLVLLGSKGRLFSTPGFIPFICFLPMAFFFVGSSVSNDITQLEKRLGALEEKLNNRS
jgi:hypothetical protein